MVKAIKVQIKRVYDPLGNDDGLRVLVDRLWPRGLKKTDARIEIDYQWQPGKGKAVFIVAKKGE